MVFASKRIFLRIALNLFCHKLDLDYRSPPSRFKTGLLIFLFVLVINVNYIQASRATSVCLVISLKMLPASRRSFKLSLPICLRYGLEFRDFLCRRFELNTCQKNYINECEVIRGFCYRVCGF